MPREVARRSRAEAIAIADPALTIVGGRPHGPPAATTPANVATGIEQVLVRAAADDTFRRSLLCDAATACHAAGFELAPFELATLAAITRSDLERMLDALGSADVALG